MKDSQTKSSPSNSRRVKGFLALALLFVVATLQGFHLYEILTPKQVAALDQQAREMAAERLAAENLRPWDSHPDPDIGLLGNRHAKPVMIDGTEVQFDRLGLRTQSVVHAPIFLLGGTDVFGKGVAESDRTYALLEDKLRLRHIGVPHWNISAATSFLRRQLSGLRPSMVIHLIDEESLDDTPSCDQDQGIANFTAKYRERGDVLVSRFHPTRILGTPSTGHLLRGLDFESRHRATLAGQNIQALRNALSKISVIYLAIVTSHEVGGPVLKNLFGPHPPPIFRLDSAQAKAWESGTSTERNALLAQFIESVVTKEVPPLDETVLETRPVLDESQQPGLELRMDALNLRSASQIHGGIDRQGWVSPYASAIFRCAGQSTLTVSGRAFPYAEAKGTTVSIYVDNIQVAKHRLEPDEPFSIQASLPEEVASRDYVSVRFMTDDFLHHGDDLRRCVAFQLNSISFISP